MNNSRHSALFTIPSTASVTIIGAGGLGATTALTLAKMGYRYMYIYDGDVVAPENTGTQLHKPSDVGKPKVDALGVTLLEFSDELVLDRMYERVTADTRLYGQIVISAVDSIQARKDIWQAVLNSDNRWYIEMRMGAEELQIHTVDCEDQDSFDWYDNYIDSQTEEGIPDVPCTEKSTFFCGMVAGGMAGSIVRKIHTGIAVPKKIVFNLLSGTYMEI